MKYVFMIAGEKRAGKDFVADLIKTKITAKKYAFADPIKEMVCKTFDISTVDLDKYKNDTDNYGLEIKTYPNNQPSVTIAYTNFRKIIQSLGNEASKSVFGEKVWTKLVSKKIKKCSTNVVISDFRFMIEHTVIEKLCAKHSYKMITINVVNNDLTYTDSHTSENELKDFGYEYDYVIDNTGNPDLTNNINTIISNVKNI